MLASQVVLLVQFKGWRSGNAFADPHTGWAAAMGMAFIM
jgi:hypothetical protein